MMVSRKQLEKQLEKMSKLPVLPQILVNLNHVASDDSASAEDLGKVILKDQSLTLRVLKVVNSSYYRRSSKKRITTITKAVVILGFNGVRRLALGLSVFEMLSAAKKVPSLHDFWSHSLLAAIAARLLARHSDYTFEEEAFVCGLVHDIGKLVLAFCAPVEYNRIIAETEDRTSIRRAEKEVFGMHHGQAGRKLASRWGMPPLLIEAIGEHHYFDHDERTEDISPLLKIVIGANRFAAVILQQATAEEARRAVDFLIEAFDLNRLQIEDLQTVIVEEYGSLAKVFELEALEIDESTPSVAHARPEVDREELLKRLQAIAAEVVSGRPAEETVEVVLDGLMASVAVERLFLVLLDEGQNSFRCQADRGLATPAQALLFAQPVVEDSLLVYCAREGAQILDPEAGAEWRRYDPQDLDLLAPAGLESTLVIPIAFRSRILGLLWMDNPESHRELTSAAAEAATPFANNLALILGQGVQSLSPA